MKRIDPLAALQAALAPLDSLNFYLMQYDLSQTSPRHIILSQLWMLQQRLEGEWDRLQLKKHPKWLKILVARRVHSVFVATRRRAPTRWQHQLVEIERNLIASLSH
jgi:hypothetical protein